MRLLTIAVLLLLALNAKNANAQEFTNANDPKVYATYSPALKHAMREARMMRDRGYMEHFLGTAPGATFSGVGYGRTRHCDTCRPEQYGYGRNMRLIADAQARDPRTGMWYRSRHWAR